MCNFHPPEVSKFHPPLTPLDETWRRDFRKATVEADYEMLQEMIERTASPRVGAFSSWTILRSTSHSSHARRTRLPLAARPHRQPRPEECSWTSHAGDGRLRGLPAAQGGSPAARYPRHLHQPALTETKGKVKAFRRGGGVWMKRLNVLYQPPSSSPIEDPPRRSSSLWIPSTEGVTLPVARFAFRD